MLLRMRGLVWMVLLGLMTAGWFATVALRRLPSVQTLSLPVLVALAAMCCMPGVLLGIRGNQGSWAKFIIVAVAVGLPAGALFQLIFTYPPFWTYLGL